MFVLGLRKLKAHTERQDQDLVFIMKECLGMHTPYCFHGLLVTKRLQACSPRMTGVDAETKLYSCGRSNKNDQGKHVIQAKSEQTKKMCRSDGCGQGVKSKIVALGTINLRGDPAAVQSLMFSLRRGSFLPFLCS